MANVDQAFRSEDGFYIDEDSGIFIGGGTSAPTLDAPVGSRYFRTNGEEYVQAGPGQSDWELESSGDVSDVKAGEVLKASFSGTPKTTSVTFNTAFADTNYAIALTPVVIENVNSSYLGSVESKTTSGFTINLLTNNVNNLIAIHWIATPYNNP